MRKQKTAPTFSELAILASSCGLVENSEAGRQAFTAWLGKDQKGARKALFTRIDARRVAAAKKAQAPATQYPSGWRRAAGIDASAATAPATATATTKPYPRNWLRGTGTPAAPSGTGPRITEARDG